MLRKAPGLGLLGVGLKPTTSTLSLYIPEESRAEEKGARTERLMSLCQKSGKKIKALRTARRERKERETSHLHHKTHGEEEEEGRPSKACPGPSDLLAPRTPELHANFHSGL